MRTSTARNCACGAATWLAQIVDTSRRERAGRVRKQATSRTSRTIYCAATSVPSHGRLESVSAAMHTRTSLFDYSDAALCTGNDGTSVCNRNDFASRRLRRVPAFASYATSACSPLSRLAPSKGTRTQSRLVLAVPSCLSRPLPIKSYHDESICLRSRKTP